jgi:hypothetical protein
MAVLLVGLVQLLHHVRGHDRSFRLRPTGVAARASGHSHGKEFTGACADTNSCSSCVPIWRTTRSRDARANRPCHRGRRRPDRQAGPVGPPPTGLSDRPPSRRLVLRDPVRGPGDGDRRAGARPPDQRGSASPPRDPRGAPGSGRSRGRDADADLDVVPPPSDDEEPEDEVELIDESESEAAPAAID